MGGFPIDSLVVGESLVTVYDGHDLGELRNVGLVIGVSAPVQFFVMFERGRLDRVVADHL